MTTSSLLHVAYTTPDKPGSFGGVCHPFVEHFGCHEAECYLRTQEAYTLRVNISPPLLPKQKHFTHRKTLSKRTADLYQADLVDLLCIANYDSYHYLLTCIDVFSKRAWATLLCSSATETITSTRPAGCPSSSDNATSVDTGSPRRSAACSNISSCHSPHCMQNESASRFWAMWQRREWKSSEM